MDCKCHIVSPSSPDKTYASLLWDPVASNFLSGCQMVSWKTEEWKSLGIWDVASTSGKLKTLQLL